MQLFLENSGKANPVKSFFWIALFEIMIGGAGRIFAFGGVTFRMVSYGTMLLLTGLLFLYNVSANKVAVYLTGLYIIVTLLAVFVGIINNADKGFLVENILMSSFFLTFPFFSMMIKTKQDVQTIVNMFKASSLIMAVLYFVFLTLLLLKIIPFQVIYNFMINPEFAFRGDSALFYKGFFFMCCGFFFFINGNSKWNYIAAITVIIAVIATFVRGFAVAIASSYLIYLSFLKNILWGVLLGLMVFILYPFVVDYYTSVLGNRSASDKVRYVQIDQVKENLNAFSIILGMGYGKGVKERPNHFEVNFLEIFYKQGLIGLTFWISILAIIIYKFFQVKKLGRANEGAPFVLSSICLYIQSISNPFLSNSIGMTLIFVSYLCLDILSKEKMQVNG